MGRLYPGQRKILGQKGFNSQESVIQQLDPIYVDVTQSANDLLRLRRELASGQLEKASENAAQVTLTATTCVRCPL